MLALAQNTFSALSSVWLRLRGMRQVQTDFYADLRAETVVSVARLCSTGTLCKAELASNPGVPPGINSDVNVSTGHCSVSVESNV